MMRNSAIAAVLTLALAAPVWAEETAPGAEGRESVEEGFSLLGEGARLILRGLQSEMTPMLEALSKAIDDVNAYEMPEVLENGDILIRRKVPGAPVPEVDPETGATDL